MRWVCFIAPSCTLCETFEEPHFLSHILLFPVVATPLSSQLQANHSLITTSKIPAYFLQFSNFSNLPHYPWILQLMFLTPLVSNLSFSCIVLWSIMEIKNLATPSTCPLFLLHVLSRQNWRVVKYTSNYLCEWMWLEKIHKMLIMTTDKNKLGEESRKSWWSLWSIVVICYVYNLIPSTRTEGTWENGCWLLHSLLFP